MEELFENGFSLIEQEQQTAANNKDKAIDDKRNEYFDQSLPEIKALLQDLYKTKPGNRVTFEDDPDLCLAIKDSEHLLEEMCSTFADLKMKSWFGQNPSMLSDTTKALILKERKLQEEHDKLLAKVDKIKSKR